MANYKLGTHNSMSYLKPLKWWYKPFHFMSKCQEVCFREQYEKHNARYFDLRIRQDKDGQWYFAHGQSLFKGETIDSVLYYLNGKQDVAVRIVLEMTKRDHNKEVDFVELCERVVKDYPNIFYFHFYTKADWSILMKSPNDDGSTPIPQIYEACSSTTGNILDDWWPWLYARKYNKDNFRQGTKYDFLVFDFINIKE